MHANLIKKFHSLYSTSPRIFRAPGRINLIGEHTDYNDGFVLPGAIDKSIDFAMGLNDNMTFRFFSLDYDEFYETEEIAKDESHPHWVKYLIGVLAQFQKEGISLKGVDCVFGGNIPVGAGLSSSAAIECGFAFGLNALYEAKIPEYQLVKMAQKAEHEYAGVMCGIMDQFASMFGKEDHVFRLDCRTHEHDYFPLKMDDHVIALCDTRVKHALASSEYNQRRMECEKGVEILRQYDPQIIALRDINIQILEKYKAYFDPVVWKRCHYVVSENSRVEMACQMLQEGKLEAFGQLMYQSHEGLKLEYEVSCKELDTLVNITHSMDEVVGARMMGGGFGGCTINLVRSPGIEYFKKEITSQYHDHFNKEPLIYFVKLTDGTHELK